MNRIKKHLQDNKKVYVGIGIGAGVTIAGFTCLKMRTHRPLLCSRPLAELPCSTKETLGSSFNNISGTVIANNSGPVVFGGYTKKIIQNVNTGQIFESVGDAATAAEVPFSMMSRHINGHLADLHGDTYRIIGLNTQV